MLYTNVFSPEVGTPQTEQSEPSQVQNNAGGYVYAITDEDRLTRFLVLGTEQATYYQSAQALTMENAKHLEKMIRKNGEYVVSQIVDVSVNARAPKQDAGLFALAACVGLGDLATRRAAYKAIPKVCRYHATLMQFLAYVGQFRKGYSGGLQRALRAWYADMPVQKLAYNLTKYRERKYGHRVLNARNILRMIRPTVPTGDEARRALYAWQMAEYGRPAKAQEGQVQIELDTAFAERKAESKMAVTRYPELKVVSDFDDAASAANDAKQKLRVSLSRGLTHEMVPDAWKDDPDVWNAFLEGNMPMGAMLRNLSKMTRIGLLTPKSEATKLVIARLGDEELLRKARIHPAAILTALGVYKSGGEGGKTDKRHIPVPNIEAALDEAFYKAFPNLVPAGKRTLIGVDVSGSMHWSAGMSGGLTAMEAAIAIALFTVNTEPEFLMYGFATDFRHIPVQPGQRIHDVINYVKRWPMGGTDCALPMVHALNKGIEVDTFVVLTDNETWAGQIHPMEALNRYRAKTGIPAKLAVMAMTPTPFSIADPNDAGSMDFVGFDAHAPKVLADFSRGSSVTEGTETEAE